MAWVYLLFAGLFEIGWPVGLKFAQILIRDGWYLNGDRLYRIKRLLPMASTKANSNGHILCRMDRIGAAGIFCRASILRGCC